MDEKRKSYWDNGRDRSCHEDGYGIRVSPPWEEQVVYSFSIEILHITRLLV